MREYSYDYRRMVRYSSAVQWGNSREKLQALIIIRYHGIEKGLSLPQPRPGFGRDKVAQLIDMLRTYIDSYGADYSTVTALNALDAYLEFNAKAGGQDESLRRNVEELRRRAAAFPTPEGDLTAGCRELTEATVRLAGQAPFETFMESRCTVRQFSDEPVDLETLRAAVKVAQKTPSVCNRQPWRAWVVSDDTKIKKILEIGGGARGFEDQMKVILLVTSDLACFQSPGERNQCWIDGGMFGMALIQALHAQGLASCCMNWSKTQDVDRRLRRMVALPESESIIFLLGVGHPREEFLVAASARKPLDDVLRLDQESA
ncbi:MAG: nitroreductase family protein [Phycisphaerales bacterium]|nr:MAG: nitroreductase family protein [Phycisphaerales bacterium]